jgi:hypothetical protein
MSGIDFIRDAPDEVAVEDFIVDTFARQWLSGGEGSGGTRRRSSGGA